MTSKYYRDMGLFIMNMVILSLVSICDGYGMRLGMVIFPVSLSSRVGSEYSFSVTKSSISLLPLFGRSIPTRK